jgi:hypothetical protein
MRSPAVYVFTTHHGRVPPHKALIATVVSRTKKIALDRLMDDDPVWTRNVKHISTHRPNWDEWGLRPSVYQRIQFRVVNRP